MRSVINYQESAAIAFNSLGKEELQNVCGKGTMCWDSKTNTLYYVPSKPAKK